MNMSPTTYLECATYPREKLDDCPLHFPYEIYDEIYLKIHVFYEKL
jgi:hypothetical protein